MSSRETARTYIDNAQKSEMRDASEKRNSMLQTVFKSIIAVCSLLYIVDGCFDNKKDVTQKISPTPPAKTPVLKK